MSTTTSSDNESNKNSMMFILDVDCQTSKYKCPLTTCNQTSQSIASILNHMWKFKKKNAPNKSCTGQTSPSITLYPKFFESRLFSLNTNRILSHEYPQHNWETIQKYINPSDNSLPNIISLIKEFNFFVTNDFLQSYRRQIHIPSSLKHFILETDFDCHELPLIISNIHSSDGPAHKKRKISSVETIEINNKIEREEKHGPTLSLPSLNMSPKSSSHTNSMMNHISSNNSTSISFDLNKPSFNNNRFQIGKKRRRQCGPQCNGCNASINPCHTMIKCIECIEGIIICINCFKQGKEFRTHKRFHKYNVLRPLINFKLNESNKIDDDNNNNNNNNNNCMKTSLRKNNKLSHNKWNGNDEWNLLYGIKRYGLGNWSGITKIINKNNINTENIKHFDYKHVEQHFHKKYKNKLYKSEQELNEEFYLHNNNNNNNNNGRASSVTVLNNNSNNNSNANANNNNSKKREKKFTDKHKLKCGYRELRDEFEAEWNNDAEAMIGEMYFSEYDTAKERRLKMEGLRLYNGVLEERKIRKQFIKNYGVIYNKRARNKKNLSEEELKLEEEISGNLSKFARYTEDRQHNFSEFKSLIYGLMEEKKLREKIYKLRHYLLNGITSISIMNRIEKYIEMQHKLELKMINDDGIIDIENDNDMDIDNINSSHEYVNKYHGCGLDEISTYLRLVDQENKSNKKSSNNNNNNNNNDNNNNNKIDGKNWNLKTMNGFKELNEGEIMLCNVLKVSPNDYKNVIQKQISKRVYLHGLLKKDKIPQQLYIDINDVKNVKDSMTMKIGLVDPRVLVDQLYEEK